MKIPLKYNLRSLWVRRVGTFMTALGIGLTVAVLVIVMALVHGLDSTFVDTGYDTDLVIIRQGSQNETNSYFNRDIFQTIKFLPGIGQGADGQPLAVGEIVVVINPEKLDGGTSNVVVRGVTDLSYQLRPEVRITEGRRPQPGLREMIVSQPLSTRFKGMRLGDNLPISDKDWKIVGIFDAGQSAYNSELWADYNEVAQAWSRPIYTSILVRAASSDQIPGIAEQVKEDRRIQLQAVPQKEYYRGQTISSVGIKALGFFIAVVMGIGSCFAAANLMYGTIMARFKEVGTLRALGFKRRSILASFLFESLIIAFLGGIIGCLIALPVHGISTGTTNFASFSEILFSFRITPGIVGLAVLFSGTVGVLGGFLPALRAARLRLIEVLRD